MPIASRVDYIVIRRSSRGGLLNRQGGGETSRAIGIRQGANHFQQKGTTMRGSGFQPHQNTIDRYTFAASPDDVLTVGVVEGVNLDAPHAALQAYRTATNREDDFNLFIGQVEKIEGQPNDGWHRFYIRDPMAGVQNISVFLIGSRRA